MAQSERRSLTDLMGQLGYDATTPGNHEFDYGPEILARLLQTSLKSSAGPAFVCSDLIAPASRITLAGIKPNMLMQLDNGLKVGIIFRKRRAPPVTAGLAIF
ncbi:hypothetical protein MASR1M12_15560 [Erysipelotrichia bacterium]